MDTIVKHKNLIIGIVALLLIFVAYLLLSNKPEADKAPSDGCPASFTINPLGSLAPDSVSITYSTAGGKYYSQASGGIGGYSAQLAPREISQKTYMDACDKYKSNKQNT